MDSPGLRASPGGRPRVTPDLARRRHSFTAVAVKRAWCPKFRMLVESQNGQLHRGRAISARWAEIVRASEGLDTLPEETAFFRESLSAARCLACYGLREKSRGCCGSSHAAFPCHGSAATSPQSFLDLADDDEAASEPTDGARRKRVRGQGGRRRRGDVGGRAGRPAAVRGPASHRPRRAADALSVIERGTDAPRLWRIRGLVGCSPRSPVGRDHHAAQTAPTLLIVTAGRGDDSRRTGTVTRRVGTISRGDGPYAALHSTARHDWRGPPAGISAKRRLVSQLCGVVRDRRVRGSASTAQAFCRPSVAKKANRAHAC